MSEEKDLKGQEENRETDAGFESKGQEMPGTAGQNERTPGKRKGWRKQTADPKKAGEEKDTAASPGGPLVREKARWRVIRFMLYFLMMFMLIAGLSAKWVTDEWGDLSLDEVMFTITQPLKGTDSGIIWGYIGYCIVGPVVLLAVLLAIYHLFLMPKQPPKGKKQKKDGKAIRAAGNPEGLCEKKYEGKTAGQKISPSGSHSRSSCLRKYPDRQNLEQAWNRTADRLHGREVHLYRGQLCRSGNDNTDISGEEKKHLHFSGVDGDVLLGSGQRRSLR